MTQLVIEIDSPESEAILLALLPKLDGRLVEKIQPANAEPLEAKKEKLQLLFQKLQESGVAEKYGDPSEWQRETRQDRPLIDREE